MAEHVAPTSELMYTMTLTSMAPSREQGNQAALEAQVQVTTIWRPWTFKPQPYLRTTTSRILFAKEGASTLWPGALQRWIHRCSSPILIPAKQEGDLTPK